jgi:putative ABC transport system permease protein
MLSNYLTIAYRNLRKQRVYGIINTLGLATGIASGVLIALYVTYEFSHDRFWKDSDRMYKLALERKYPDHTTHFAVIPHSFADAMKSDFPEVEAVMVLSGPFGNTVVAHEDQSGELIYVDEENLQAADSAFFRFFSVRLLKGDSATVLTKPGEVVLTKETADRYFGTDEPLNKVISFLGRDFIVTGVCENIPENSHFDFDFLVSRATFPWINRIDYTSFTSHVYIRLIPGADPTALETKLPKMVDTYAAGQIEKELGKSWEQYKNEGNGYRYYLQPLTSVHLDPTHLESRMKEGGNLIAVYSFTGFAALILVVACINFMNLSTARSAERAHEVGIRMALGSTRRQLRYQFLFESVLLSLLATVVALLMVYLTLPYFIELVDRPLTLRPGGIFFAALLLLAVATGLLAGSYPAFVLSSFNPALAMKGTLSGSQRGAWLRNGLVVFQFVVSISLIVGTLIVREQMRFLRNRPLGYDRDRILIVERLTSMSPPARETLVGELRRLPGVESVCTSFTLLCNNGKNMPGRQYKSRLSSEILTTRNMLADDSMQETLRFRLVSGQWFSTDVNDSLNVILNETAVRTLGLSDPVGQKIDYFISGAEATSEQTIIGVVEDFNFMSLRDSVTPLAIQSIEAYGETTARYAYVRLSDESIPDLINTVGAKWKELAPELPFKYMFLDESLRMLYRAEERNGRVLQFFSVLAVLIACVGLFGLAAYGVNLRTREIGIRKVLGSSVLQVVVLLTKDITRLVTIAIAVASPFSWIVMKRYFLDSFAYRIPRGAGIFLIAAGMALLIAWITVSYLSIRAALGNPVDALRSE